MAKTYKDVNTLTKLIDITSDTHVVAVDDETNIGSIILPKHLLRPYFYNVDTFRVAYIDVNTVQLECGVALSDDTDDILVLTTPLNLTMPEDLASGESELAATNYGVWIGHDASENFIAVLSSDLDTAPAVFEHSHILDTRIYNDNDSNFVPFSGSAPPESQFIPIRKVSGLGVGVGNDEFGVVVLNDGAIAVVGEGASNCTTFGDENVPQILYRVFDASAKVIKVVTSVENMMVLLDDNTIRTMGRNASGQLGVGNTTSYAQEVKPNVSAIREIACITGAISTTMYAIDSSDNLYAWGANSEGYVGDGTTINKTSPQLILTNVDKLYVLSSGRQASLFAVLTNGTVKSWGDNSYGQLGHGSASDYTATPTLISGLSNVESMYLAHWFEVGGDDKPSFVFCKTSSALYGWGYNGDYNLGTGSNPSPVTSPTAITTLPSLPVHIAAGSEATLFVLSDGSVYGCGLNSSGNLGTGNTTAVNTVTQLSITNAAKAFIGQHKDGRSPAFILKTDGTLWGCGGQKGGQLGNGVIHDTNLQLTYVQIPVWNVQMLNMYGLSAGNKGMSVNAVDSSGKLFAWGEGAEVTRSFIRGGVDIATPTRVAIL